RVAARARGGDRGPPGGAVPRHPDQGARGTAGRAARVDVARPDGPVPVLDLRPHRGPRTQLPPRRARRPARRARRDTGPPEAAAPGGAGRAHAVHGLPARPDPGAAGPGAEAGARTGRTPGTAQLTASTS